MATFLIHEDDVVLKENVGVGNEAAQRGNKLASAAAAAATAIQMQRRTFGVQLNNVQLGARAHAHKTAPLGKPLTGNHLSNVVNSSLYDENAVHRHQLQLATQALVAKQATAPVNAGQQQQQQQHQPSLAVAAAALHPFMPLEAFKAFSVYEDKELQREQQQLHQQQQQHQHHESSGNQLQNDSLGSLLDGSMRHPLHEIKEYDDEDDVDNVSRLETPMSVAIADSSSSLCESSASPMSVDKSMASGGAVVVDVAAQQLADAMRLERERFFDVREYQADILDYLKSSEAKHLPKFGYMRKQPDINQSMRTILVDWLVEVCEEYRLQSETLCLAVSYIDRFLSTMSVMRAKLQLVGTAAMFIAAKYEEIFPPDVNEFVYITDHTYTKKQVLRMEQLILKVLTFDLFVPTTTMFVNLYATMTPQGDNRVQYLTGYLCELSLLEADPYLQFVPSLIAAAALALARHKCGLPVWTARLQRRIGYSLDQLHTVLFHLVRTADGASASAQQAIQDKYRSTKFLEVSNLVAEQPFDEEVFQRAVDVVSRDVDNDTDDDNATVDNQHRHQQQQQQQKPTDARTFA